MSDLEIWADVSGYEGLYQVSSYGMVRSKNKVLSPWCSMGYSTVALSSMGKARSYSVHRLVAKAFIENPHNYPIVNHIDGNSQNNNVKNLEWCTRSHNTKHAWDHGLIQRNSRLDWVDVLLIRDFNRRKMVSQRDLSDMFSVSQRSINQIINYKRWTNFP